MDVFHRFAGAPVARLDRVRKNNYRAESVSHVELLASEIARDGLKVLPELRPLDDGWFEAVSGHHRCEALELLGYVEVPYDPITGDDRSTFMAKVASNEGNLPTSKAEKAKAAHHMHHVFGMSFVEIAPTFRVSSSTVSRWVRIVEALCESAIDDWANGFLSDVMAWELVPIDRDRQASLLSLARGQKFSVKAWAALVENVLKAQAEDQVTGLFDAGTFTLQAQDMADAAKASVKAAKLAAKDDRERLVDAHLRLQELQRRVDEQSSLLRQVAAVTAKSNKKLAAKCRQAAVAA